MRRADPSVAITLNMIHRIYQIFIKIFQDSPDELVHDTTGHPCMRVLRCLTSKCLVFVRLRLATHQLLQETVASNLNTG